MQAILANGPKKCPHLGCNRVLSMADLEPDPEFAKKIQAFQRRERARNADQSDRGEDDDEVIE